MAPEATTQLPPTDPHGAKLLAEIERQPGQTKFGLQARLKLSNGPAERALRRLIDARLVGVQRDERGRARYVAIEQWLRGVSGVGTEGRP